MGEVPDRPAGATVEVPASVTTAVRLVWALVALTGVTALLTWLLREDLVRSWARGDAEATALLREGGMAALERSAISVPAFVSLALTSFVVLAGLALVLVAFFRTGHEWARWSLVATVLFAVFTTGVSVARGLPPVFQVLAWLTMALCLALLVLLLHPRTSAFLRRS